MGQNEDTKAKRDQEAEELRLAYVAVFNSPKGQMVMSDLMFRYGFDEDGNEKPSYIPNSSETHEMTAWREGSKEVVRYVRRQTTKKKKQQKQ